MTVLHQESHGSSFCHFMERKNNWKQKKSFVFDLCGRNFEFCQNIFGCTILLLIPPKIKWIIEYNILSPKLTLNRPSGLLYKQN